MREQAIAQKVGSRSGLGNHRRSSPTRQRRRRRESGDGKTIPRLRAMLGYVPLFLKLVLAIVAVILIFTGYRVAASASFFQVHRVEVQGATRVSADEVQALVRKEVERTGVWKADLKGLHARLEKFPWVRTAVVSRVLPDGIRVRLTERVPRAVVRTASGRFRWVDDDAVLLGEMLPTDQIPPFFLRGLSEDDSEAGSAENRERVAKFLELQREWEAAGLSERVSEVNLFDIRDIRAQLAGDDSQIEIRLGSQDHGKRLKDALQVLETQKQAGRGSLISYVDLGQGNRAIVGLTSGAHASDSLPPSNANPGENGEPKTDQETVAAAARASASAVTGKGAETKTKQDRTEKASDSKADKTKKPDRARSSQH